jgi:hypothetical protein
MCSVAHDPGAMRQASSTQGLALDQSVKQAVNALKAIDLACWHEHVQAFAIYDDADRGRTSHSPQGRLAVDVDHRLCSAVLGFHTNPSISRRINLQ